MPASLCWGAYTLPLGMEVVVVMGIKEVAQIRWLEVAHLFRLVPRSWLRSPGSGTLGRPRADS